VENQSHSVIHSCKLVLFRKGRRKNKGWEDYGNEVEFLRSLEFNHPITYMLGKFTTEEFDR
jgi:hypothetical protein